MYYLCDLLRSVDLCLHFCMCRKTRVAHQGASECEGDERIGSDKRMVRGVEDKRNKLHFLLDRFFSSSNKYIFVFFWTLCLCWLAAHVLNRPWTKRLAEKFGLESFIVSIVDIDFFLSSLCRLCTIEIRSCYLFHFSGIPFWPRILSSESSAHRTKRTLEKQRSWIPILSRIFCQHENDIENHKTSYQAHWNTAQYRKQSIACRDANLGKSRRNHISDFLRSASSFEWCFVPSSGLRSISLFNGNWICYFLRCCLS